MSITEDRFDLALRAMNGLAPEIALHENHMARHLSVEVGVPNIRQVLAELGSLPKDALFLGMASDGLPVLLNLQDPVPGPLLVVGDNGVGKTNFLKTIAHSITITHKPSEVLFGVVTGHTDEWDREMDSSHRVAIFPASHTGAQDLLLSLASWARSNENARRSVLLLMDDIEILAGFDFEVLQNLRWLLLRGPARHVWPILTMNSASHGNTATWLPAFRTRIFGRIENGEAANALGGDKSSRLDELQAGAQFSLRENGSWLRFWLPAL